MPESKELASEKPGSANQSSSSAEVTQTEQGGQPNQQTVNSKHWTREQNLEFVDSYKKFATITLGLHISYGATQKSPESQALGDRLLILKWRSSSTKRSKNYEVKVSKSGGSETDAKK